MAEFNFGNSIRRLRSSEMKIMSLSLIGLFVLVLFACGDSEIDETTYIPGQEISTVQTNFSSLDFRQNLFFWCFIFILVSVLILPKLYKFCNLTKDQRNQKLESLTFTVSAKQVVSWIGNIIWFVIAMFVMVAIFYTPFWADTFLKSQFGDDYTNGLVYQIVGWGILLTILFSFLWVAGFTFKNIVKSVKMFNIKKWFNNDRFLKGSSIFSFGIIFY